MSLSLRPRGHRCLIAKLAMCPLLFALGMPVSSQDVLVPSSMMNVVLMDVGQHCPQLFRADSSWVSGWNQPLSTTWELGNAGSRAPLGLPMQTPRAAQPTPPPPGDMGARWSWNTSDGDGDSSPHALPSRHLSLSEFRVPIPLSSHSRPHSLLLHQLAWDPIPCSSSLG